MQYFSSERKQKPHITETRPSHNYSSSESKPQTLVSESNKTFIQNEKYYHELDSYIKFSNGWVFEGQHFQGKFHGWGMIKSDKGQVVYKGNFQNGFFHNSGKIYYHPIFSYLFQEKQINKWIKKNFDPPKKQKNSLRQIQVTNPFRMKINKKRPTGQQKQSKIRCVTQYAKNSQSSQKIQQKFFIQWLKYEGDFLKGNATGFGTLKIKLVNSQAKETFRRHEKIVKIVGKFLKGQILAGIIK